VCAELTLTPEQATSAERTLSDLYVRADTLRGKKGPEVVAARRAIDQAMPALDRERADVCPAHPIGPARPPVGRARPPWSTRPVMADSLGLTESQRQSLAQAVKECNTKRLQGQFGPADERKLSETALRVLTPDQRNRWLAMPRAAVPICPSGGRRPETPRHTALRRDPRRSGQRRGVHDQALELRVAAERVEISFGGDLSAHTGGKVPRARQLLKGF